MKKYVLALLACLFVFPAAAETLPGDVYEALTQIGLKKGPQSSGQTADQEQLAQYRQAVQGVIIVKVGFAGCAPCKALARELQSSGLIDLWNAKGFRFYELSSIADAKRAKPNFLSVFGANTNPMMFFFKNGELQTVLRGFDASQPDKSLQPMRDWTNSH